MEGILQLKKLWYFRHCGNFGVSKQQLTLNSLFLTGPCGLICYTVFIQLNLGLHSQGLSVCLPADLADIHNPWCRTCRVSSLSCVHSNRWCFCEEWELVEQRRAISLFSLVVFYFLWSSLEGSLPLSRSSALSIRLRVALGRFRFFFSLPLSDLNKMELIVATVRSNCGTSQNCYLLLAFINGIVWLQSTVFFFVFWGYRGF